MTFRSFLAILLLVPLIGLTACSSKPVSTPEIVPQVQAPTGKISASLPGDDTLKITAPALNAVVSAPLVVKGEARGGWYFEASFPIRLLDSEGNELARVPAQAQGDWMTEAFVPFVATFDSFDPGSATIGKLVFEKDNPSGMPENEKKVEMEIRFR